MSIEEQLVAEIKPYINDNLTLHDVLEYMEPFLIYQDDVTAAQYKEMTAYISQKIIDRKKEYVLKTREYNTLKSTVSAFKPKLVALFETNQALREAVIGAYGLTDSNLHNMPSEEFVMKINR